MKYPHLFILFTAASLLLACQGEESPKPEAEDLSAIRLSEKSLDLSPDEGSRKSVDVITEDAWALEGLTDGVREWLSADVTSGNGPATVTFQSDAANPYNEPRVAVMTFRSGTASARVLVRQTNDPERRISLSEEALVFSGPVGQEQTVEVETAKPWVLDGYTDEVKQWISVEPVSGEANATVTLKVLTANMDIADRVASLGFRIDRVHCAHLQVSQTTGLTISASESELSAFPFDTPSEAQLTITTNTDKYPWHVEGLTAEVKTWLSVTPESATGTETQVTVKTISVNEGSAPRTATLSFCLSEQVFCTVAVSQQAEALKVLTLSWKGTASYNKVIKGGADAPHEWFPWVVGSSTMGSKPDFLNGKDGAVVASGGSYTKTGTWLFQDNETKEWFPLEMGPIREPTSTIQVYYLNHGNDQLRWRNSYIKIPAKAGFRLTHIYMNSFNAASNATLILAKDKACTQIVEGINKKQWGKNDPLDMDLTETQEGVDYYVTSVNDRWMDAFVFTYTEVR